MSCWRTMKLSPKERISVNNDVGRDRLSEMPDDVIIRILSFMSTRDAVRTMLLRRFGNLWTLVPSINLDILEFFHIKDEMDYWESRLEPEDIGQFYLFGRNVLILHKRLSIDKLCLHIDSYQDDESIAVWLRFAFDRQAKEIRYCDSNQNYLFHEFLFLPSLTSQYLVTLELRRCRLKPQHRINLGSLKKLLLDHVVMSEDALQRLFSGCPSLRELGIIYPYEIEELTFRAPPNLHRLSLELDFEVHEWKLDLSNVKSLDLNMSGVLDIIDVSSVRDVFLRCDFSSTDEDEYPRFKKLLGMLKEAETFQLPRFGTEIFLHSQDDLQLLHIRWKRVILELPWFCESCLVGICELLSRLEHLEELILRSPLRGAEELEFVKRLSSFRRASTKASVVFVFSPLSEDRY